MTIENHRHPEAKDWEDLRNDGYNVIPLKKGDKAPAIKWEKFKCERATDEQILRWQEHSPDANIGVVTGIISGIFVLDLDNEEAIIEAERRGLPQTPRVRTGKGQHIYFRYPQGQVVKNRVGFLPGMDIRGEGGYVVAPPSMHPNGSKYEWITRPDECPLADAPEWVTELLLKELKPVASARSRIAKGSGATSANEMLALAELEDELEKLSETEEGSRNNQLNMSAMRLGQIVATGALDTDHVKSLLYDKALSIGLEERETRATIHSGFSKGLSEPRAPRPIDRRRKGRKGSEVSEDAIAQTFTQRSGQDYKFCHTRQKWYKWSGTHWMLDAKNSIAHVLRKIAREMSDGSVTVSRSAVVKGAESLLRADPAHAVDSSFWDRDQWLLGTPAGTIDLREGVLRPAQRGDGITRVTACAPVPGIPKVWRNFLLEACGYDEDFVRYLRDVLGYALTGDTSEHALFFFYGSGGNGKSVFLNTASGILNDYAATASMDTFTASYGDRHPTDLAMLDGPRMVSASETEEGRAWAESRIKWLTGGDKVTARYMRQDFFQYQPLFKLFIVGNHAPSLRNVDEAARRRFHIVPFTHVPENPDRELEQKLKAEWPQILSWMIEGCIDRYLYGLVQAEVVSAATDEYFEEQDTIGRWLDEECEIDVTRTDWVLPASLAFERFQRFSERLGERPGTSKRFGSRMATHGFRSTPQRLEGHVTKAYLGLRLKAVPTGFEGLECDDSPVL